MEVSPVIPGAVRATRPTVPVVYHAFRRAQSEESASLKKLKDELQRAPGSLNYAIQQEQIESLLAFWEETVPEALNSEFTAYTYNGIYKTLIELEESLKLPAQAGYVAPSRRPPGPRIHTNSVSPVP